MKNTINYMSARTSLAHTFGNATSYFTEWLKLTLHEIKFKTVHIHSAIASKQMQVDKEFFRKEKPIMIIRPRMSFNETDTF